MKCTVAILTPLLIAITVLPAGLHARTNDSTSCNQVEVAPPKSPELAGTLSWIFPGLGQVYNGRAGKGLLQMELFMGGIAMIAGSQIGFSHESITPAAWISVGIVAGTFIWSVIDAVLTAESINTEWRGKSQFLGIQRQRDGIRIDVRVTTTGAMAGFAFTF